MRLKQGLESGTLPKDLLIDGPAGTGKTYGILATLHTLARDYAGLRILICRQSRASLTESVLATFEEEVLPADGCESIAGAERRDHRAAYRYPNKSRIVLGGLDKPGRILSTAWDVIYSNEAIELDEAAWDTLGSRLNRPGRDRRFGFLIGDTNPGDPSHWLKRRCDEGRTVLWKTAHAANPALFDANGWTVYWGPYRDRLKTLVGPRRKRLFEGLWAAGEGQWFSAFDADKHVGAGAEYDPRFPVHLSVDTGVHTGAVLWQIREANDGPTLVVFADYYSYDVHAFENAKAILRMVAERCGGRFHVGRYDPAGGAKSGFGGLTIASEFQRAGLRLEPWPKFSGCITAGLNLLESFVAVEPVKFRVHPRCTSFTDALSNYLRKKRGNHYIDEPVDDQHPYSDLIDPLRSGLIDRWPEGRVPQPAYPRVPFRRVF